MQTVELEKQYLKLVQVQDLFTLQSCCLLQDFQTMYPKKYSTNRPSFLRRETAAASEETSTVRDSPSPSETPKRVSCVSIRDAAEFIVFNQLSISLFKIRKLSNLKLEITRRVNPRQGRRVARRDEVGGAVAVARAAAGVQAHRGEHLPLHIRHQVRVRVRRGKGYYILLIRNT